MRGEAFLGSGWEEVRLKIPKGKYRVVMLDFWEYKATIIQDLDTLEEAMELAKELKIMEGDPTIEFVIYNDKGEEIDMGEGNFSSTLDIPVPGVEDVFIHLIDEAEFVAVAIFLDDDGKFEDLLFDNSNDLNEAKQLARNLREKHPDASRVMVLDRKGNVVWEEK